MSYTRVGILHPGEMGIFLAASAQKSGCQVCWASDGRSPATRDRAEKMGLQDAVSLAEVCRRCDLLISVCPPAAALDVAQAVITAGYSGAYLDANAISPQRCRKIDNLMQMAGIPFIDGGIIGGPDWDGNSTMLYLCGVGAEDVAACFDAGPIRAAELDGSVGAASALKMCYAALTKGTTALLCAVLATGQEYGVLERLLAQWDDDVPGSGDAALQRARRVTAKAWRFEGEMAEIATTFRAAGLPDGFHLAAGEIYQRLGTFKKAPDLPPVNDVIKNLLQPGGDDPNQIE